MEIELTQDQELFRDTTRRFLETECPLTTVRDWADNPDGFDRGWWRRGAELGWTALLVPDALGGGSISGNGLLDLALVAEEMGRLVSPGPLLPTNVVAAALASNGTDEQRATVLEAIVAGEVVASWCLSEPGGRWDAAGVQLEATAAATGTAHRTHHCRPRHRCVSRPRRRAAATVHRNHARSRGEHRSRNRGTDAVAWKPGETTGDFGVGFVFRQGLCLGGGSNEMQRNIISERLLGMPRDRGDDRDLPFSQVRHNTMPGRGA